MPNEYLGAEKATISGPSPAVSAADAKRYEKNRKEIANYRKQDRRNVPSRMIARPARNTTTNEETVVYETTSGGGSGQQYITPNYQQHVFIAISLSIIIVIVAAYGRGKTVSSKTANQYLDPKSDPIKFGVSWLGIAVVLLAGASFRGTDKLAAAFAWLIFVAVLLINGEQALSAFQNKVHFGANAASSNQHLPDLGFGSGNADGGGGAGGGF